MQENIRRFKIPTCPPTTNKCIRFPNDVIENIEKTIKGTDCTFTAFVVEAVKFSLDNINSNENIEKPKTKNL